jgi:Mg-chelatase subunit ChlD
MSDKLAPKNTDTTLSQNGKQLKISGLRGRIMAQSLRNTGDPFTVPNRVVLILDCSGSMAGSPINDLKTAVQSFITYCDPSNTSLGLEAFEATKPHDQQPLTLEYVLIQSAVLGLQAHGGTPMAEAMENVLLTQPASRCVLVSDGAPDSEPDAYTIASQYREARIPVDCVHIGHSSGGEDCLKKIAEMTGGKYIKFSDINNLVGSFKYLSPAMYGILTSGSITAEELGANEIK